MTHHLVLDVGGTTTTLGILAADKTTIIHQLSEPTQAGVLYFPEFIGDLVKRLKSPLKRELALIVG